MATIKQIAELAGVSRGTVDRVLNNRGSVNANTAARVREIAEKLNYQQKETFMMRGNIKKEERKRALDAFRSGKIKLLISSIYSILFNHLQMFLNDINAIINNSLMIKSVFASTEG